MTYRLLARNPWVAAVILLVLPSSALYAASAPAALPPECVESSVQPGSPRGYIHFESIAGKIVVRGCLETPEGRTIGASFILDTGAGQSGLNPTLAEFAGLKPLAKTKATYTPAGVAQKPQVELAALLLGGHSVHHLAVALDENLVPASKVYETNFGGVIGTDVLSRYVVSIDFPYRRVALFDKPAHVSRSTEVARFPFEFRHGCMVVKGSLSNGSQLPLMFDTGIGGLDADIMVYEDSVKGIELQPPIYSIPSLENDVELRVGHIPFFNFETIHVESPTVAINPAKLPNVFGERYTPGYLGPILFENYTVEIDFPNRVVRVFSTKPRFQQIVNSTGTRPKGHGISPK